MSATVLLSVKAEDSSAKGWKGLVTSPNNPGLFLQLDSNNDVLMDSFARRVVKEVMELYPNSKFKLVHCEVKDGDDCGYLPAYLRKEFKKLKVLD